MIKYRFDSASLCVGFKGIAYFGALVIDLEEVAVFSCDMTSLGKYVNKYDDDDEIPGIVDFISQPVIQLIGCAVELVQRNRDASFRHRMTLHVFEWFDWTI